MNFSVVFVLAPGTSEALHHIQLTNWKDANQE